MTLFTYFPLAIMISDCSSLTCQTQKVKLLDKDFITETFENPQMIILEFN